MLKALGAGGRGLQLLVGTATWAVRLTERAEAEGARWLLIPIAQGRGGGTSSLLGALAHAPFPAKGRPKGKCRTTRPPDAAEPGQLPAERGSRRVPNPPSRRSESAAG